MIEVLRKSKGKAKPITINQEIRAKVASFKEYLKDYMLDPYTPKSEQSTIYFLLYGLEDYEQNILISYYEWGNDAARMLGVTPAVLKANVMRILNKVQKR